MDMATPETSAYYNKIQESNGSHASVSMSSSTSTRRQQEKTRISKRSPIESTPNPNIDAMCIDLHAFKYVTQDGRLRYQTKLLPEWTTTFFASSSSSSLLEAEIANADKNWPVQ